MSQIGGEGLTAFLSPAEIETLTGYKRPADQVRWLQRNAIPYLLDRCRRPVIRRDLASLKKEPELGVVR